MAFGPDAVSDIDAGQTKVQQQLQQLCPDQELSWKGEHKHFL